MVLGAGSWGTALSLQLARNGHVAWLWGHSQAHMRTLREERRNSRYFPEVSLPPEIRPIEDWKELPEGVEEAVLAVPCDALPEVIRNLRGLGIPRICLGCKGFQTRTDRQDGLELNHQWVREHMPDATVAVLSGPSFAQDLVRRLPVAVTVGADDLRDARHFADLLHGDHFRIYTHDDLVGVQVGGALKNVMAIAVGVSDGLRTGAGARAALMTRGLHEIIRLGRALGGRAETFMGLSGMGDLVLTCGDDQSRNRRFGLALARGLDAAQALREINQAVEGMNTALKVWDYARSADVDMPITEQVVRLIRGDCAPRDAVAALLSREPKTEADGEA